MRVGEPQEHETRAEETPTLKLIEEDLSKIRELPDTSEETVLTLMDVTASTWETY
jgi:hypothetical protein